MFKKKIFLFIIALILLILHEIYFIDFIIDDSFISYRYAKNLASGNGLVFNIGEKLEGYSNFIWTLILGLFIKIGLSPILTSKILGIIFSILNLFLLIRFTKDEKFSFLNFISIFLIVLMPSYAIWAVAGLETQGFSFLLLWLIITLKEEERNKFPFSVIPLSLLPLFRPEGVAFLIIILIYKLFRKVNNFSIIVSLLIFTSYLIWKYFYYGSLIPNTFYAKTGKGFIQFALGLFYFFEFLRNFGSLGLLILIYLPLIKEDKKKIELPLIFVTFWFLYIIYKGHDPLPSFRFFVMILPLIYLLLQEGIKTLYLLNFSKIGILLIFLFLICQNLFAIYRTYGEHPALRSYQMQIESVNVNLKGGLIDIAKILDKMIPKNCKIAVITAGAIPYYTNLYTIDRWGLLDEYVAKTKPKGEFGEKYDADYILSREPEIIQTNVTINDLIFDEEKGVFKLKPQKWHIWGGDVELFSKEKFLKNYEPIYNDSLGGYLFFKRKGLTL